jgi:hypothetical protein
MNLSAKVTVVTSAVPGCVSGTLTVAPGRRVEAVVTTAVLVAGVPERVGGGGPADRQSGQTVVTGRPSAGDG